MSAFFDSGALISLGGKRLLVGEGHRTWSQNPSTFYFPDFFLSSNTPWFTQENLAEMTLDDLIDHLDLSQPQQRPTIKWENDSYNLFKNTFLDLLQRFQEKELSKAVPFVFESSKQKMTQPIFKWALTHVLQYAQKHSVYLYGFWDQNQGILGATPEILFTLENKKLKTMACAGTARGTVAIDYFLNNPKELHEHQLVIEGISSSLHPIGKVSVGDRHVLNLPGLSHLITPIEVTVNSDSDFESVVKALHPTPALGAHPKDRGKVWLQNYQKLIDRQRFGAPVGCFQSHATAFTYVAIRNIQWDENGIKIGAGCGVVPASQLEKEWQEIQTKITAIKNMMGL